MATAGVDMSLTHAERGRLGGLRGPVVKREVRIADQFDAIT